MSGLFVRKCAAAITGQPVGTAPVVAADGARGADIDSASVEWSFFGNNNENYRPVVDPVISRIETHSFDPYAQARPDLYAFQRDAKKAITYYSPRKHVAKADLDQVQDGSDRVRNDHSKIPQVHAEEQPQNAA